MTSSNVPTPATTARRSAKPQLGILADLPAVGRYLFFGLAKPELAQDALRQLQAHADGKHAVVGVGRSLAEALGVSLPGLRGFPTLPLPGTKHQSLPADDTALWCWLRADAGQDQGHLLLHTRALETALNPAFKLRHVTDAFSHAVGPSGHGHDLTGYEDGTENPAGRAARAAALVTDAAPALHGSSFVAVQQWLHDFKAFGRLSPQERDHCIGRRQSDNEELDDAPESAHVKRTAQESFTPEAFVVRRSMPWAQGRHAGLMFVAFGHSLDAFEAQMRRMVGLDDGIVDALFKLSKPVSGAYFWCPPMAGKRLDLRALGLE